MKEKELKNINNTKYELNFIDILINNNEQDFNNIVKDLLIEKLAEKAFQLFESELKTLLKRKKTT